MKRNLSDLMKFETRYTFEGDLKEINKYVLDFVEQCNLIKKSENFKTFIELEIIGDPFVCLIGKNNGVPYRLTFHSAGILFQCLYEVKK